MKSTTKDRFIAKIDKSGDCWIWKGATNRPLTHPRPYGQFSVDGKTMTAHRAALIVLSGVSIPENKDVCHSCDNTLCVNPAHLFIGSRKDNMQDAVSKGRYYIQKNPDKGPNVKLTVDDVVRIRTELRDVPNNKIAKMYGIQTGSVQDIKKSRIWKHVPPMVTVEQELRTKLAALEAENASLTDAGATYQKKWMDAETLLLEKSALEAELKERDLQLRNLLCIIHRDGGHHTQAHGLEQSIEDAKEKFFDLRDLPDTIAQQAENMLRLIETVKYLRGIAERGTQSVCPDDMTVESFVLGYVKELESDNRKQAEQLAAAEKDAERYRWLRSNHPIHDNSPFICRNFGAAFSQWTDDQADKAIDAAIAAGKEGKS